MQIVCLDQNAASFLAKANPKPIWREIREALVEGFHKQKLVCPLPFECVVESTPKSLEFRQSIQTLFWQLSEGMAFKAYTAISNELTLALIRPTPNWTPWISWKPVWAEMGYAMYTIKSKLKSGKQEMAKRVADFARHPSLETMSERELFHSVAAQRSSWICGDLDRLIANQSEQSAFKCSWLIEFLLSEKINRSEIEALKRAVQHHEWAKIPLHAYEILLGAKWEYDSIRNGAAPYSPNDETDRKRGAIALSYSDVFITEGDMANLCKKAKVSNFSPTIVLSVRSPEKILTAVRSIVGS